MKFGIDLGHGVGPDRGAVGNIAEETIIDEIGIVVIKKLKALGHTVVELRPATATSVSNSLYQRYHKADINNCDWCVSIHANAGKGVGTEVYTYGAKEIPQAKAVLINITNLGFRNRGIKDGSHLAMVKRPKATSMLIEVCFVDSADSNLYNSIGAEKIADAIVKGLTGQTTLKTKYKIGWNEDSKGKWYSEDGTNYYKDCWKEIDGCYYSFNPAGYARKSTWLQYKGYWYWLKKDCTMARNEWLCIDDDWYYFGDQGGMYSNCFTPDNYFVDSDGAWNRKLRGVK